MNDMIITFLIVIHNRLSNEPKDWNHIQLFVSSNNLNSCRLITTYSDLLYNDEFEEFKRRMNCSIITIEEFRKLYWKDDWSTARRGDYKKYSILSAEVLDAINTCNHCDHQNCYRGCKFYKILSIHNS
jgi:Fe-S-cluster-containing dehydrogenase component